MHSDTAVVEVHKLNKTFRLYRRPLDRVKQLFLSGQHYHSYQALTDISFRVGTGQTLGIVGPNGAGKSTLLKLLSGILLPDSGELIVRGRITALLELGTGFNPAMSGRDNIMLNGMMLGMSQEEIQLKTAEIIAFSELEDFIEEPVATYSSGMSMRLAFAIAIHAEPVCLIVDEALSVGDVGFQQKCMRRIEDFKRNGGAIIFVSHDMNAVKRLCDSAIMLEKGHITAYADAETVINRYHQLLTAAQHDDEDYEGDGSNHGTGEATIRQVTINQQSNRVVVTTGESVDISVHISAHSNYDKLAVGIIIRDQYGQDIFGTNSYLLGEALTISAGTHLTVSFNFKLDIAPGEYSIGAAIHRQSGLPERNLNWVNKACVMAVLTSGHEQAVGIARLPATCRISD